VRTPRSMQRAVISVGALALAVPGCAGRSGRSAHEHGEMARQSRALFGAGATASRR
jgi:hypothetical protein